MKLNDNLTHVARPICGEAQALLGQVLSEAAKTIPIIPVHQMDEAAAYEGIDDFFENLYVKSDYDGVLKNIALCDTLDLSRLEASIIDFLASKKKHPSGPYVLVDHAGKGKSTVLKFVALHLFRKTEELGRVVWPIYISLRMQEDSIHQLGRAAELRQLLTTEIKERTFKRVRNFLSSRCEEFLQWVNDDYPSSLQGRYPQATRSAFAGNFDRNIAELANSPRLEEFILAGLTYYSLTERTVALLFDDADNFGIDTQRALLDFANLLQQRGLRALVAIRHSSWQALEARRPDADYQRSPPIEWTLSQLRGLLEKRLDASGGFASLRVGSMRVPEVSAPQILHAFIGGLRNAAAEDLLLRTSNYNLHSLIRKLHGVSGSWHFDDIFLFRTLLKEHAHGAPLWLVIRLIFGSYRGTFRSSDDMARQGLVNCFCTQDERHLPYSFFIRLHFLTRLRKTSNDGDALPVSEIEREYSRIFGDDLSFSKILERTMYRLVQGGLVFTKSCRRYQDESEIREHIREDSVYLSDAGRYYIDRLCIMIDYLYFMKDDVDWPDSLKMSSCRHVEVGAARHTSHAEALKALNALMRLEVQMLEGIRDNLSRPNDALSMKIYAERYSARGLAGSRGAVLFTRHMLQSYVDYFRSKDQNYSDAHAEQIEGINRYMAFNMDVEEAFQ